MKINELYESLKDALDLVNSSVGIINTHKIHYLTPINPNYDYSGGYDGYEEKNYYFRGEWDFSYDFLKVLSVNIVSNFIVTDDIKKKICAVCPTTNAILGNIKSLGVDSYINTYLESNPDKDDLSDFDECIYYMEKNNPPYISSIEVDAIDNNLSRIIYSGSFFSAGIHHGNEADVVCELNVKAAQRVSKFYFELLIEAYALLNENNFKMSYFMSYAALENYINEKINGQNTEERFQDKFKKAYDTVPNLSTHETYSKLYEVLGDYTLVRNIIAHGRDNDDVIDNIDEESAKKIYIFVAVVILVIEKGFTKLKDVERYIKPKK